MSVITKISYECGGFDWLLPQCFDLSFLPKKICWNECKYVLSKQLDVWNIYRAITSYCPKNNYLIHPAFNFNLPTHWGGNSYNVHC